MDTQKRSQLWLPEFYCWRVINQIEIRWCSAASTKTAKKEWLSGKVNCQWRTFHSISIRGDSSDLWEFSLMTFSSRWSQSASTAGDDESANGSDTVADPQTIFSYSAAKSHLNPAWMDVFCYLIRMHNILAQRNADDEPATSSVYSTNKASRKKRLDMMRRRLVEVHTINRHKNWNWMQFRDCLRWKLFSIQVLLQVWGEIWTETMRKW